MAPLPRLNRGPTLALLCAVYFGAGLSLASIGPNLSALAANVDRDVALIGSQFTAFSLGTVVVQFVVGPFSDRYGQRTVLSLGLLMMGLGILGESLSRELTLLLVFAGLGGLGFGSILSSGSVLVPRLFPVRGTSALNLVNLFFGVGSIVGPLVAGRALAQLGSPLPALWLGAGLLLGLFPLALLAAEADVPAEGALNGSVPWLLVLLLGCLLLVYSGTEIALGGWAALYLEIGADMAPAQAAIAVAGFWFALTVGRGAGALLGLRFSALQVLLMTIILLLSGSVLLFFMVGNPTGSIGALLVLGLAFGPIFPTTMALVALTSGGRGTAAAVALAIGNSGGAIIPPLMGLVLSRAGPPAVALLVVISTSIVFLLACAVVVVSRRAQQL
ncbi:MFS transporter [Candidatus Chloroploca asiatica]|uniref:MFS transporter n=1 Tax=Candidatus Chloroploca asiatica TaxID=1506545 RepID=UPI000BE8048F|nr:MFS transporter [Candidatus Chloroploca asiatica]